MEQQVNFPKPELDAIRLVLPQKRFPFSSDRIYDRLHFIWSEGEWCAVFSRSCFYFLLVRGRNQVTRTLNKHKKIYLTSGDGRLCEGYLRKRVFTRDTCSLFSVGVFLDLFKVF